MAHGRTLVAFEALPPTFTPLSPNANAQVREAIAKLDRRLRLESNKFRPNGYEIVGDVDFDTIAVEAGKSRVIVGQLRMERPEDV